MKKFSLITLVLAMQILFVTVTFAQPNTNTISNSFISVPSSAFSGRTGGVPGGNRTGTARFLQTILFAPVNIPHGATVTSFKCGGSSRFKRQVAFKLRRNEPQQANIDLATIKTGLDKTGFEFIRTNSINSSLVNNSKFNYYIVAEVEDPNVNPPTLPFCTTGCSVGYCSIGYGFDAIRVNKQ